MELISRFFIALFLNVCFCLFSIGCTHGPPLPPASVQQYGANDKMDTRATHIYQGTPHLDWAETEDIYYDFYIFLYTYTIYIYYSHRLSRKRRYRNQRISKIRHIYIKMQTHIAQCTRCTVHCQRAPCKLSKWKYASSKRQKQYSVVVLQVGYCYKVDVKSWLLQRTSLLKMMITAVLETPRSLFNNNEVIWWEVEWKPFPDIDERETSWNMTAPP